MQKILDIAQRQRQRVQNLTDRRVDKVWRALWLENEYLKCLVLPDLGGHLYGCTDKRNGQQLFYANPSIKLAAIA